MVTQASNDGAFAEVAVAIQAYFRGIYHGDIAMLREVFDPRAELFGDVRGQPYHSALERYLQAVAGRQSPEARGEAFDMRIRSIEVKGAIARATLSVPMLGYRYVDFLNLMQVEGRWRIVGKVFADIADDTKGSAA